MRIFDKPPSDDLFLDLVLAKSKELRAIAVQKGLLQFMTPLLIVERMSERLIEGRKRRKVQSLA